MSGEEQRSTNYEDDCDIASLNMGEKEKSMEESEEVVNFDDNMDEMSEEEKRQFEAHKLASMCYCEKLNSRDEDENVEDKPERVKFADTVVVCPTYTSQVG